MNGLNLAKCNNRAPCFRFPDSLLHLLGLFFPGSPFSVPRRSLGFPHLLFGVLFFLCGFLLDLSGSQSCFFSALLIEVAVVVIVVAVAAIATAIPIAKAIAVEVAVAVAVAVAVGVVVVVVVVVVGVGVGVGSSSRY